MHDLQQEIRKTAVNVPMPNTKGYATQGAGPAPARDFVETGEQAQGHRPTRLEQLVKQDYHHASNAQMRQRAIDILQRHPEFEEFLELQELLRNVQLY